MKSKPSVPPIDPPKRNTTVGPVDEADDEAIELVLIEKQKNISKKEDEINSHIKKHEANSIYCSAIDRGLDQIAFSFCKHSSILKKKQSFTRNVPHPKPVREREAHTEGNRRSSDEYKNEEAK